MKYKILVFTIIFTTLFNCIFAIETLNINSKSAVVIDADSSIVLYEKNPNKKIYPASTTKIITAILAIENLDLNKHVVVSKTAINIPWDSSSVYLKEGEILSINDLLYCLLLNSGNDAANVLAEAVSGDIPTFIKLMNIKAKEIGCTNTHFNNAHGYSDNEHYTTALDMAKIFKYCIQNDTFKQIISTKSFVVEATNKTSEKRYLKNTNRLILKKQDSVYSRYYEYCLGGKTGYTDEAGRTLITYAKKDDKTVIVAIFGASAGGSQDVRYTDAINLFEYSFDNFSKNTIALQNDYTFNYINTDLQLNYTIGLNEDVDTLLKNKQTYDISYSINIDESSLKNVNNNNFITIPVGEITFNIASNDNTSHSISKELYLKDVQKYNAINHLNIYLVLLLIFVVITVFTIYIILVKNSKKSRKMRKIKFQ